jgi:hypothetical protein
MLLEPEFVEAMALHRAMSLAWDKGVVHVMFASDRLLLIQRLHSKTKDRSRVGVLTDKIRFLMKDLTSILFIHAKRELNGAAHLLAKFCNSLSSSEIFISAPDCIHRTLCINVI